MDSFAGRWVMAFFLCGTIVATSYADMQNGMPEVRGVNLGGWLVVEGWIKPSLFDGIPNSDMLDGTKVQFKSTSLQKYVSAFNGGGQNVTFDRDIASSWETFRLWRVSSEIFQLRTFGGQFLASDGEGGPVSATDESATGRGTFTFERYQNRVHIKLSNGNYLQANSAGQLTADYPGRPGWDDHAATFEMTIVANDLHGDYQLANGYGPDKSTSVLSGHRNSFVTQEDFRFLSNHGINTVRIPVGWWIASDPTPPPPFVGGSLASLDKAFLWAQTYGIKCIVDLHAAPGSQNGMEHSASRDGSADWAKSPKYIFDSLNVIEFLASSNMTAEANIEFIYESRLAQVQALNSANGPLVFVGEWVNEWNVQSASKFDYQDFGDAQLQVYDQASFGWCYWTLKNARKHWDFEWNILNNYLQLGASSTKLNMGSTYFLILSLWACLYLHHVTQQ
ncbi:uncharacterized protein LOC18423283 isoform X3 [Amborella trichopoda]|uniref:uncharacterized protein LOC18423283 isoform X3 n=1 Tax=Amborella trichopoda TaxID=13333 RepID=UPI0009BE8816|nr:uncharacterized protein LOC18423283 isoform X3 [Amborella trichopoda]|eukprot:XP_020527927.1 uncharacterized protein LOC18423283 isoform X3 [Amborella trichopoda]